MEAFKAGDVVELVAAGPRMTVEYVRPEDTENPVTGQVKYAGVGCVWFDATNQLRRGVIAPSLLKHYRIPDCADQN